MKICVISDLHIGAGKEYDTFAWNSDDFILMLEHFERKHEIDKIILNGDIIDLYQHSYLEIEKYNAKIISYFKQDKFVYIRGNHDISARNTLQNYRITNSQKKIIHFEHGHQADFMNGTAVGRKIGKFAFQFLKYIIHFDKVQRAFMAIVRFNDRIDRIPRKYDTYKYLNYALKLFRKADFVVLGHTHKLEEHKTYYVNKKKTYVNCGSCSLGRFQCVLLDTETLKFDTIKMGKKTVAKRLEKIKQGRVTDIELVENK